MRFEGHRSVYKHISSLIRLVSNSQQQSNQNGNLRRESFHRQFSHFGLVDSRQQQNKGGGGRSKSFLQEHSLPGPYAGGVNYRFQNMHHNQSGVVCGCWNRVESNRHP